MKNFRTLLLSTALLLSMSPAAGAKQDRSDLFDAQIISTTEPVFFAGDRFTYNLKASIITGSGDIRFVQNESSVQADTITIHVQEQIAEVEGNVVASHLGDIIEGERGYYDYEKEEGAFHNAHGYVAPWYFSADTANREPDGKYSIEGGSLTTCDPSHEQYRLQAGSTTIVPDEKLTAKNVAFYAGPIPIFYMPRYSQSLGDARPPIELRGGSHSDVGAYGRLGYNLEPFDWLMLNPHVWGFTKSGFGAGLDGRLELFDGDGRGRFDSLYVSDQNNDNTDEAGIDQDRGKADLYYRQELPYDMTALLQVEYITDAEFLKTFDFDEFKDREQPETFFNLERTTPHSVVSFTARERLVNYIQDVDRMPELRIELLEQRILDTGLFYSAWNDAAYLDIESGGPDAARDFAGARLSRPLRLWKWLGLVPYIEGDATYYSETLADDDDEYRLSWETGIVGQSRFQRVFASPFKQYSAFRHLVVPTVAYRFRPTPDDEPEELPQFDSIDSIDRKNMLELELRNYLQARRQDGVIADLAEYTVTAGFEFDDAEDQFAVLENELLVRPAPNWEFAVKSLNDFRDARRADLVSAVARYTRPDSFSVSLGAIHEDTLLKPYETRAVYSLSKAFGPWWRAGFEQQYDIGDSEFAYQEFWLWHDMQCLEVLLSLRDSRESTSVMLVLNISAFPTRRIDSKISIKPPREGSPWPTRW